MVLDDRKRKILQAIIDDYVNTAEPVGSRTIARKYELGLSSATIRNEMADLEEMGYLEQPHTSAGRIPSDKGYRLYVDQLMRHYEIAMAEADSICRALEVKMDEINQLIRNASGILSSFTRYTSIAIPPIARCNSIRTIQLVVVDLYKVLVILVNNAGIVKNKMIRTVEEVELNFLSRINNILNVKLHNLTVEQITINVIRDIEKEARNGGSMVKSILDAIADIINDTDSLDVILDGTTNIFNFPEYNDIEKARDFLNFLEGKDVLCRMLTDVSGDKINISIGKENRLEGTRECSVVSTSYSLGDRIIGSIGIIGPTRMEYPKVVASMEYIRQKMNEALLRIIGDDDGRD